MRCRHCAESVTTPVIYKLIRQGGGFHLYEGCPYCKGQLYKAKWISRYSLPPTVNVDEIPVGINNQENPPEITYSSRIKRKESYRFGDEDTRAEMLARANIKTPPKTIKRKKVVVRAVPRSE